ncbi:hypothetical protein GGR28_000497 [Lewinella aquimaris]|uniref:Uncharacterized protein n=1 Tax=Neolewinella aquimaris TaxID=1835722 RepID=A0A840EA58_9BACT|nr:hypothetical protein [Neolewinella aquimaris]MBB4077896.1 hypothetical protein [Neolewinella aquimaris]
MRDLSELVELVGTDYDSCTTENQQRKQLRTLFKLLQTKKEVTAGAAARALGMNPGSAAFRKVKHTLKLDLLNLLCTVQPQDRNTDQRKRKYNYVWKLIVIGKQLRTTVSSGVLLPFLEEAFRIAEDQQFYHAAFEAATMLRRQYNNRNFRPDRYVYFRDRAGHYRELSWAYHDVVTDLNEIFYLRNSREDSATVRRAAAEAYRRSAHLIERFDVAMISYIVYLIELNVYLAENDYDRVIQVANKAIAYLEGKPDAQSTMFQVFEANLSVAYTQRNDYTNGMAFARKLLAKTGTEDHNYIKVYELMLVLSLRAEKFQQAYDIYRTIRPTLVGRNLLRYYYETFRIIEAYLYLLFRMDQIEIDGEDRTFSRFRISRFLNSFEHSAAEKSHRNVHLLIIEIVGHIVTKRHSKTAYSIEAVVKYARRHLRDKGHRRIKLFLKALSQLSAQSFHRSAVERHSSRYLKQLEKHPITDAHLDYYMELIPFDTLWTLILQQLGYKRVRKRREQSDET